MAPHRPPRKPRPRGARRRSTALAVGRAARAPRSDVRLGLLVLAIVVFLAARTVGAEDASPAPAAPPTADSLYAFEARRLDGEVESLARYRGQVLLIVNTASRCGNTPQYEGLQSLYAARRAQGLVVLGFPSNDFAGQEPGSDRQIGEFCKQSYGVEFPMFSKVHVKGPDAHPVYVWLTSRPAPVGGPVGWNFQKYLVDRSGRVAARFDPRVQPESKELVEAVDRLLAEPAPGAAPASAPASAPVSGADAPGAARLASRAPTTAE